MDSMYSWLCVLVFIGQFLLPYTSSLNLSVPPDTLIACATSKSPATTPAVSLPFADAFSISPALIVPSNTSVIDDAMHALRKEDPLCKIENWVKIGKLGTVGKLENWGQ